MNWRGLKAAVFREIDLHLPPNALQDAVAHHNAQQWFVYAGNQRSECWHVWWPSLWLAPRLASSARILETGCGCGLNLIWFGQHGWSRLSGFDVDRTAIAAGKELCERSGIRAHLWVDDGMALAHMPRERFDVILALNWTYLVEKFSLSQFLELYQGLLADNGYLVIDLIDTKYNDVPNNQYLTSDWGKPEELRKCTEYKVRYSPHDVRKAIGKTRFQIGKSRLSKQRIPRRVYIFRRIP